MTTPVRPLRDSAAADAIRADLLGERRHDLLELDTIRHAGTVLFGGPETICLYGRTPTEWYGGGARILGRTCVEAALDSRATVMADAVLDLIDVADGQSVSVMDLFLGSGNLLMHLAHRLGTVGDGMESDARVHSVAEANFATLGIPMGRLRRGDWSDGVTAARAADVVVFVVAPPWGSAFSFADGLDLRRTAPPVATVVDRIRQGAPAAARRYAVVQTPMYEPVTAESVATLARPGEQVRTAPGCLVVGPLAP